MSDIFLSYSSADRERARALVDFLSGQGWSVWWDRTIPPGKSFDEIIEEALNSAKCVVVLWSKNSVSSMWVKTEAAEGLKKRILVPVLLDDVIIPLEFRRIQAADLRGGDFTLDHPEVSKTIKAISDIIGHPAVKISQGTATFRGARIPDHEGRVLEELEKGKRKPFKLVGEINRYTESFVVENNSIVALALGSYGSDGPSSGLPDSIGNLKNLRTLDLSYAKLITLPDSFGDLTSLLKLNLDSNEFGVLPESICRLSSLEELNLNYNELTSLPEEFGNLTNLRVVSFEHNRIRALPKSFKNLQALEDLDLWENRNIAIFPEEILELKGLKELSINGNSLLTVPEGIGGLEGLRILRLDMNEIGFLPSTIGRLKNLEILTLGWNKLGTLPETLGDLSDLKELELWDAKLTTFPECICRLTSLEKLSLGKNKLTAVPETIGNLRMLKDLRLYNNKITSLPESIGNLNSLEVLYVDSNLLTRLPKSLGQIQTLQSLCITDNPLLSEMDESTKNVLRTLMQRGVEVESNKYGYK